MKDFKTYWETTYPDTIPVSQYLKHGYPDRWCRIHSLPGSRRYPSNEGDWGILLERQNTIIKDLLGTNASFFLVTGEYQVGGFQELHQMEEVSSIRSISFTKLEPIDLYLIDQEQHEMGQTYTSMFAEQVWQPGKFNEILKDIAEDNMRALFVSTINNCIIAPYDGGMDIIVKDNTTRDLFKEKYSEWLSTREDGL